METIRGDFPITATEALDNGRALAVIAVNDDIGDGKPIPLRQMSLEDYERNPVVMFEHGSVGTNRGSGKYAIPVGRSTSVRFTERGMESEFEWLPGDPEAARVRNAWEKGFLRAASVRARRSPNGFRLVEWSIVAVPADADAVRSLLSILPEGDAMDAKQIQEAVRSALGDGKQLDPAEVARSLTGTLTEAVTKAVKEANEAAETARAEQAAAEQEATGGRPARALADADARADLLITTKPLLPKDFDPKGKAAKEILVAAVGDEVTDAAQRSEDYLMAKVEGIVERREKAASGRGSQPSEPIETSLAEPLSVHAIRQLEENA